MAQWPIALALARLIAGFLMMLHVTADVTGRYFFSRPLEGTTEIVSAYYMVIVAYLPWAYLARNDTHIVVGMFQQLARRAFEHWLEIAVKIFTAVSSSLFVYQTISRRSRQTRSHEVWQAGTMYHAGLAEPLAAAAVRRADGRSIWC